MSAGEPGASTTAIVDLLPAQGGWEERDYLWLSGRGARLVELVDGRIELPPMPTDRHQGIVARIYEALRDALGPAGIVRFAPLRLRTGPRRFREPDVLALLDAADPRRGEAFWRGADLVVEVLSPDDPARDLVAKRAEYAAAGIPEYWIVDPDAATITVLALRGEAYAEVGTYDRASMLRSPRVPGVALSVAVLLDED